MVGDGQTPPAGHPGHFRNPLPLSDGTLIAVQHDVAVRRPHDGGAAVVALRLSSDPPAAGSPYWTAGRRLIPGGISKSISYWDNTDTQAQLQRGAVGARPGGGACAAASDPPRDPAAGDRGARSCATSSAVGGLDRLRAFLAANGLALIVSRNVTRRADRQQDFNLQVAGRDADRAPAPR